MKSTVMEHFKNLCIVLRLETMNTGTALMSSVTCLENFFVRPKVY